MCERVIDMIHAGAVVRGALGRGALLCDHILELPGITIDMFYVRGTPIEVGDDEKKEKSSAGCLMQYVLSMS